MLNASNLNFTSRATVPNAVVTKVGTGGNVCVFTSGSTHLIADINGYFTSGNSLSPLQPARLFDTRPRASTVDGIGAGNGIRTAGSITELVAAGHGGVPLDAAAVVLNVTVTDPRKPGYVTVWPCGSPKPNASNLNFTSGATVPNAVIGKVGTGGKVCVFTSGSTHLIADMNGYFTLGSSLSPLQPARLADNRPGGSTVDGQSAEVGVRDARSVTEVQITGRAGISPTAAAVALNVTVTGAQEPEFVTVWPRGSPMPNASNLNYAIGSTTANAVIAKPATSGKICVYTTGKTHLLSST